MAIAISKEEFNSRVLTCIGADRTTFKLKEEGEVVTLDKVGITYDGMLYDFNLVNIAHILECELIPEFKFTDHLEEVFKISYGLNSILEINIIHSTNTIIITNYPSGNKDNSLSIKFKPTVDNVELISYDNDGVEVSYVLINATVHIDLIYRTFVDHAMFLFK